MSGVVTTEAGKPAVGATVVALHLPTDIQRRVTTDDKGAFSLTQLLPGGPYALQITQPGFQPRVTTNLFFTAGSGITLNYTMAVAEAVVGSRSLLARTDVGRPLPVDLLTLKDLYATGQVDLGQQLQFTSPGFSSSKTGVNGVANYADPATLRGLAPDQMLVLLNGKRRHQFSALNLNVTVGTGTVGTDLNALPALALERVEVLRDGAAAIYGSDAIAGVINLGLNRSTGVATVRSQYGITRQGDGATYLGGVNYGLKLGKTNPGFLNMTLQYQRQDATNRSDSYVGRIYKSVAADPSGTAENEARAQGGKYPAIGQDFKAGVYGSNQAEIYQGFYNLGLPLNAEWSVYSFGGYSRKDINAYGFFRTGITAAANTNYSPLKPDGYLPELPGQVVDYSTVVGLSRKTADGWNLDFSAGYGHNYLDLSANNTINASMGATSPADFYIGRSIFGQATGEVNASRNYVGLLGTKSFNLAVGSQLRLDQFELVSGDPASYLASPVDPTRAPGSAGRFGIKSEDAGAHSRQNVGLYVDVETDVTDRLLLTAALRYENYLKFDDNVSGKFGTLLKITKGLSVRGAINRGFRAPSLQQTFNSVTSLTAQLGTVTQTKQLPAASPLLGPNGLNISTPKAETSLNYSLGLTAKVGNALLFTLDAYQIDISNRIVNSDALRKSDIPALNTPAFAGINEIRFFSNAIDTRTQGLDLTTAYTRDFSQRSHLSASLAVGFNKTEIQERFGVSDNLKAGATTPVVLIGQTSTALIERAQPRQKGILTLTYQWDKLSITPRATYFGSVQAYDRLAKDNSVVVQEFGGKTLFDLALGYAPTKMIFLSLGANNLLNTYPDKVDAGYSSYTNGETPYSRNVSQFGFNGSYYYSNITFTF